MRKKTLIVVALSVLIAGHAFSEWRIDVGADVPWGIGAVVSDLGGSSQTNVNVLQNFVFLVPEGNFLYQFPIGPIKLGAGVRAFSLVLESVAWPNAFAEVNLGPVAIDLNLGGGIFFLFGLYNNIATSSLVIPDLSAYFKLGKSFRIGGGGIMFYDMDSSTRGSIVPYSIYLAAKFSFTF